jgi:pilus assembly protein CpaC
MRRLAVGAWVIGLMLWAGAAGAMTLRPGDGRVVSLAAPVANVFVANPAVAQARPASPSSLFVFGIAPGHTTIAALDSTGHPVAMLRVAVLPSQEVAGEARAALARVLPGVALSVAQEPNGLLVTGTVATPAEAARAIAVARGFVPAGQSVDNQITVRASIQVTLQVRIVQMSRTISDKLGIDWQALGTIGSIGMLPALNIGANGLTGVPCPAGTSMARSTRWRRTGWCGCWRSRT